MKCKLCDLETSSYQGLAKHIKAAHNISSKDYYDKYIKKSNEGICICGKDTPFLCLKKGYQKHCCAKCGQKDINTNNNFRLNNPQKDSCIQKRTLDTCNERYGGRGYGSNSIQEKAIQTKIDKYGISMKDIDFIVNKYAREHDLIHIEKAYNLNNNCGWVDNIEIILYLGKRLIKKSDLDYIKSYIATKLDLSPVLNVIKDNYNGNIQITDTTIYLSDLNIAISYNDNYDIALESGKDDDYLLEKSIQYRDNNIRLIHIYQFERLDIELYLLKELLNGNDLYNDRDFNKNNFRQDIPLYPSLLYADAKLTIYGC